MWKNLTCVDDFLNRAFHKLGLVVGHHPGYFVVVPVLLACICFTGYQRIHYEIDPEYLFSPINGPSKIERAVVEQYFKVNYSHSFNLGRITRPGEFLLKLQFEPFMSCIISFSLACSCASNLLFLLLILSYVTTKSSMVLVFISIRCVDILFYNSQTVGGRQIFLSYGKRFFSCLNN